MTLRRRGGDDESGFPEEPGEQTVKCRPLQVPLPVPGRTFSNGRREGSFRRSQVHLKDQGPRAPINTPLVRLGIPFPGVPAILK